MYVITHLKDFILMIRSTQIMCVFFSFSIYCPRLFSERSHLSSKFIRVRHHWKSWLPKLLQLVVVHCTYMFIYRIINNFHKIHMHFLYINKWMNIMTFTLMFYVDFIWYVQRFYLILKSLYINWHWNFNMKSHYVYRIYVKWQIWIVRVEV